MRKKFVPLIMGSGRNFLFFVKYTVKNLSEENPESTMYKTVFTIQDI